MLIILGRKGGNIPRWDVQGRGVFGLMLKNYKLDCTKGGIPPKVVAISFQPLPPTGVKKATLPAS